MKRSAYVILILASLSHYSQAARIKDIASLRGARTNQLLGYGVIVGLAGTGDKSSDLTENSLGLVLKGLGIDVKTQKLDTKNVAAVLCSATLPSFTRMGSHLDVTVSSIGSASSLDGGTLMMTALRGIDGKVYAMAQGRVVALKKETKGGAGGNSGANLVTALVPEGATLERELAFDFNNQKVLHYILQNPDFTTAVRAAKRINEELGGKFATAADAGSFDVAFPYNYEGNPVELIAQIEGIDVQTDRKAKVIIDSKTGTVILGDQVRIAPVALAHGNLKVEIQAETRGVAAQQTAAPAAQGGAGTKENHLVLMNPGTSIADIVSSLNEMGATPEDLISLVQSLKASGALMAEVEMQ